MLSKGDQVRWKIYDDPLPYRAAMEILQQKAREVSNGQEQSVLLLEHLEVYTSREGSGQIKGIPLEQTDRGGGITYHNPGQRVIYPILNLKNYGKDLRWYVLTLEDWIAHSLNLLGVPAFCKEETRGIWLKENGGEAKIGFIGVRVSKWVTLHGAAVNIANDLVNFLKIDPCGLKACSVTSCQAAGYKVTLPQFDQALMNCFFKFFKPVPCS